MAIRLGGKRINSMYLGGKSVKEAWLNGEKVWPEYPPFKAGTWTSLTRDGINNEGAFFHSYNNKNKLFWGGGALRAAGTINNSFGFSTITNGSTTYTRLGTDSRIKKNLGYCGYMTDINSFVIMAGKPTITVNADEVSEAYTLLTGNFAGDESRWGNYSTVYQAQGLWGDVHSLDILKEDVFGGYHGGFLSTHVSLDYKLSTKTVKASLPVAMNGHQVVSDMSGDALYIVGGNISSRRRNTLYKYKPSTDTYTTLTPLPAARAFGRAAYCKSKNCIYYCGGELSGLVNTFYEYHIHEDKWYTQTPMPKSRSNHTILLSEDEQLFVFSGMSSSTSDDSQVLRFNP